MFYLMPCRQVSAPSLGRCVPRIARPFDRIENDNKISDHIPAKNTTFELFYRINPFVFTPLRSQEQANPSGVVQSQERFY